MFKFLFSLPKRILASNQDGPPDLDELFKDLRNKLGGILGQKKARNNGGGGDQSPRNTPISGDSLPIGPIILISFLYGWLRVFTLSIKVQGV